MQYKEQHTSLLKSAPAAVYILYMYDWKRRNRSCFFCCRLIIIYLSSSIVWFIKHLLILGINLYSLCFTTQSRHRYILIFLKIKLDIIISLTTYWTTNTGFISHCWIQVTFQPGILVLSIPTCTSWSKMRQLFIVDLSLWWLKDAARKMNSFLMHFIFTSERNNRKNNTTINNYNRNRNSNNNNNNNSQLEITFPHW